MDNLFGSESGIVFQNSRKEYFTKVFECLTIKVKYKTAKILIHLKQQNLKKFIGNFSNFFKMYNFQKKFSKVFLSVKIIAPKKLKSDENYTHIYFTQISQKSKSTFKCFSFLSFIGKDCHKLPLIIPARYGPKVDTLDLSFNCLTTLQGVESFFHLKELILDNNILSDNIVIPRMEFLQTLSINKNNIRNLELFLEKVKDNLPSLKYLSLLGNKACPNQLSDSSKDEEDYQRYRYYVINRLPNLRFLDSTPVSVAEKNEAKRRGHLMKIAKPLNGNKLDDGYMSSPEYTPLPKTGREMNDHQGAYGKCKYRYSGKHSEGNRFIQNSDL